MKMNSSFISMQACRKPCFVANRSVSSLYSHGSSSRKSHQSLHTCTPSSDDRQRSRIPMRRMQNRRNREKIPLQRVRFWLARLLRYMPSNSHLPLHAPPPPHPGYPEGGDGEKQPSQPDMRPLSGSGRRAVLPVQGVRVRRPPTMHTAAGETESRPPQDPPSDPQNLADGGLLRRVPPLVRRVALPVQCLQLWHASWVCFTTRGTLPATRANWAAGNPRVRSGDSVPTTATICTVLRVSFCPRVS